MFNFHGPSTQLYNGIVIAFSKQMNSHTNDFWEYELHNLPNLPNQFNGYNETQSPHNAIHLDAFCLAQQE